MKKYEANLELYNRYLKVVYKRHPLWIKRKKIRTFVYCLMLLGPVIALGMVLDKGIDSVGVGEYIAVAGIVTALLWIPGMAYSKVLGATCQGTAGNRSREMIVIEENKLVHLYHAKDGSGIKSMSGKQVEFLNIRRIVHNTFQERIDIYGEMDVMSSYDNFEKDISIRKADENESMLRIFLYYNESSDLIKTIQEKSPVMVEVINYPTE